MLDGTRPSVTGSKETRILNHARISLSIPLLLPSSFLHRRMEEEESLDGDEETGLLERWTSTYRCFG